MYVKIKFGKTPLRVSALASSFADACVLFPPSLRRPLLPSTRVSAAMPSYGAPVSYSKPHSYPALQLATSPVTLAAALTGHAVDEITDLIRINFFGFFCCLGVVN